MRFPPLNCTELPLTGKGAQEGSSREGWSPGWLGEALQPSLSHHCHPCSPDLPSATARLRQRSLQTGDFQLKGTTKNIIVPMATARAIQWGGSLQDIAKRSEMRNSRFNRQSCKRAEDPQEALLFIQPPLALLCAFVQSSWF